MNVKEKKPVSLFIEFMAALPLWSAKNSYPAPSANWVILKTLQPQPLEPVFVKQTNALTSSDFAAFLFTETARRISAQRDMPVCE